MRAVIVYMPRAMMLDVAAILRAMPRGVTRGYAPEAHMPRLRAAIRLPTLSRAFERYAFAMLMPCLMITHMDRFFR